MSKYGRVRERLVWREGRGVVPAAVAGPRDVDAPFVQQDSMAPLEHMGDGSIHDSKSSFRKRTKDLGYEEVGSDRLSEHPARGRVDKILPDRLVRAYLEAEQIVDWQRRQ